MFYLAAGFLNNGVEQSMDWTPEDTEILQIVNRVRQVLCKRDRDAYSRFAAAGPDDLGTAAWLLWCNVEDFGLRLHRGGRVFIYDTDKLVIFDARDGVGRFARPEYFWDKDIIRNKVVPALDREMVLDDLSMLGR